MTLICFPSSFSASGSNSIHFQSHSIQTALVEVYSSEGCSSCPPAEEWLSHLKTSPVLFKNFVPICFHVDYWDYIGWKDILASHENTERQRRMARVLNSSSVYTPEFIVNGLEWKGWFDGDKEFLSTFGDTGVLSVDVSDGLALVIKFSPTDHATSEWSVEAAFLGMDIVSPVTAGENRGKTLYHDFAVLSHATAPLSPAAHNYSTTLRLPSPKIKSPTYAVAVWVTKKGELSPVQAVGGFLSPPLVGGAGGGK